jgi:hypothetical protein
MSNVSDEEINSLVLDIIRALTIAAVEDEEVSA